MPVSFWGEATLTAIFLINRLPTLVLQRQTPFQRLFNQMPDYNFLRVFGCACFPWLRPYIHDKLQLRSKCYVFLGYASKAKWYHCLDRDTGRVFISRHVLFCETIFPFSTSSKDITQPLVGLDPGSVSSSISPLAQQNQMKKTRQLLFDVLPLPIASSQPYNSNVFGKASQPSISHSISSLLDSNTFNTHVPISSLSLNVSPSPDLDPSISTSSSQPESHLEPENTTSSNFLPIQSSNTYPMITRSKNGIQKPMKFFSLLTVTIVTEPNTYKEAACQP